MDTLIKYIQECIACAKREPEVAYYFECMAKGAVAFYEDELREQHRYDETKLVREEWKNNYQPEFQRIIDEYFEKGSNRNA